MGFSLHLSWEWLVLFQHPAGTNKKTLIFAVLMDFWTHLAARDLFIARVHVTCLTMQTLLFQCSWKKDARDMMDVSPSSPVDASKQGAWIHIQLYLIELGLYFVFRVDAKWSISGSFDPLMVYCMTAVWC